MLRVAGKQIKKQSDSQAETHTDEQTHQEGGQRSKKHSDSQAETHTDEQTHQEGGQRSKNTATVQQRHTQMNRHTRTVDSAQKTQRQSSRDTHR